MAWKYGIFAAMIVLGLWALGIFDKDSDSVSGSELAVTALGFVLFTAGLLGIVALSAKRRPAMSTNEAVWWEIERTKGRRYFIRRVVTRATVLGGSFLSILILYNSYGSDSWVIPVIGCLVIYITLGLASYAIADRLWNYYESELESKNRQSTNPSRNDESKN
jgi:hypothetical protein